ncbi:MAG: outer membrane beta-barrel protein [Candidatus Omnitrophica bacterium]|nr:outer membrane beta-barrel protein [Candidatus Omnitrophota bacterium]MBD3269036.1 outer membrane beta-barrel protein [Candidatus Omnitrophota bacterium]
MSIRKSINILSLALLFLLFSNPNSIFAQVKEEKEEEKRKTKEVFREEPKSAAKSRISLFSGYDSNVKLSPDRKGDVFEEFVYSFDYTKPLFEKLDFDFDYDLDVLNYNEFTDLSSILNHLRFELIAKPGRCRIGGGYDLGVLYYPRNDDGNFLFHEGFFYLKRYLFKNTFHKIEFQYGLKDYIQNKALGDSILVNQEKERLDRRIGVEYSLGSLINPRLYLLFKTKFYTNDSNARYMDFYDYKAYRFWLGCDYRLSAKFYFLTKFSYTNKDYDTRTVTLTNYKQEDDYYSATAGLRYRLDDRRTLSLYYTYRENSSNEPLEEYSESVITCGWQYNF